MHASALKREWMPLRHTPRLSQHHPGTLMNITNCFSRPISVTQPAASPGPAACRPSFRIHASCGAHSCTITYLAYFMLRTGYS